MIITEGPNSRLVYSELTPAQWQAGMDLFNIEPISHEYYEDDHTVLMLVMATSEQIATFEEALA